MNIVLNELVDIIPAISSALTVIALVVGIYVAMRWLKSQDLQRKKLLYQREELHNLRDDTRKTTNKKKNEFADFGPEGGGYIVVDMPENQKALFHDVLKGFEEYAQLRGYRIQFSIDNTLSNKIAFKFTIAESGITVSTDQVKQDLKDYIHKVQKGSPLDDLPVVIEEPEHQALLLAMKNRISFLQCLQNLNATITTSSLYKTHFS